MLENRVELRALAADIGIGSRSIGRDCNTGSSCILSTLIRMPLYNAVGTAKFGSSFPNILIAGKPPGGLVRFHPARCNTASIIFSRSNASCSAETAENVYSVFLNTAKEEIISETWISDLGAFRRSDSALASVARFNASARWASASAACFLADTMSFSNESASRRAPRARTNALDADAVAWPDASTAFCDCAIDTDESPSACRALASAAPASPLNETITLSESVSLRWLYGYAKPSASTATAKHTNPIRSKILARGLFSSTASRP